jgi:translocation and assembly module TamA
MRPLFAAIRLAPFVLLVCLAVPAAVADVAVTGLRGDAAKNVPLMLSLAREKCDAPEWKVRGLYGKADQEIDEGLRALGYYHAVIKKSLDLNGKCWRAAFAVDAGPRAVVDDVTITLAGDAANDPEFQKLRDKLLAEKGKPLRHDNYEKMKKRLEALALERGYLKSDFPEKQLLIDKAANTARINLAFDSGKRMRFGEVTIEQSILDPELVQKLVTIKPGGFYSTEQLAKTHNALSQSGYFEIIDLHPDTGRIHNQTVPVTLKLTPRSKYHYGIGLGFDTDIGPLLSGTYSNRRLNRWGHFLNANIDLSPVLSTADVEYNVPLANPLTDVFSFGGGLRREKTDTLDSLSAKVSARLKHAFANGWKQTLYIDSVYEDFSTGATANTVLLLVPGGNWLYSFSDNALRPTRGHRLELNLGGSYKNPISDLSFAQGSAAGVWMQPLPWNGRVILRAEQGFTFVDQFDKLPASYRFYAGGMNSIRGYAYKELGPRDNENQVIGGKFLSVVSAEYEHAVLDNWGVAAFIDSGNAYNPDNISVKTGAGLGVRWYSPIGPIRVDFAIPLNESDSSFQIHFAAGSRL